MYICLSSCNMCIANAWRIYITLVVLDSKYALVINLLHFLFFFSFFIEKPQSELHICCKSTCSSNNKNCCLKLLQLWIFLKKDDINKKENKKIIIHIYYYFLIYMIHNLIIKLTKKTSRTYYTQNLCKK